MGGGASGQRVPRLRDRERPAVHGVLPALRDKKRVTVRRTRRALWKVTMPPNRCPAEHYFKCARRHAIATPQQATVAHSVTQLTDSAERGF